MLSYYLKYGESTKSISPLILKTINVGTIISKCAVCTLKKQDLLKNKKQKDY